jgi:hypothetical protein
MQEANAEQDKSKYSKCRGEQQNRVRKIVVENVIEYLMQDQIGEE